MMLKWGQDAILPYMNAAIRARIVNIIAIARSIYNMPAAIDCISDLGRERAGDGPDNLSHASAPWTVPGTSKIAAIQRRIRRDS